MHSELLEFYPDIAVLRGELRELLDAAAEPIYVAEAAILRQRYLALDGCLAAAWGSHAVAYSFKTNYLAARCGLFRELGSWADVVSEREYAMARDLGYGGDEIVLNGPWKSDAVLRRGLAEGATININDFDELRRLEDLTHERETPLDVGLRLAVPVARLAESRFGFAVSGGEAATAAARLRQAPGLRLAGLHCHLYGDTDDAGCYREAAAAMAGFIRNEVENPAVSLRWIDMGGGYPAHGPCPHSRSRWQPQSIETYVGIVADELAKVLPDRAGPRLILEPGRYLVADGVILLSRIVSRRERGRRQLLTSDATISMVPLTHYCPQILRPYTRNLKPRRGQRRSTVIYGATCRENDLLFQGLFEEVEVGDVLVHYAVGAYNSNLAPQFIFDVPDMKLI